MHNIKKEERSKIINLSFQFRKLEEEEQIKSKERRRKEIIKITAEINELENRKSIDKINEAKSWLFENVNKIDKFLAKLTKKTTEKTQITSTKNERGDITTGCIVIKRIPKECYEKLYAHKFYNLHEMSQFLERYNLPKLTQEIDNLNKPISIKETKSIIYDLLNRKH